MVVNAQTGAPHVHIPVSNYGGAITATINPDNTIVVICADGHTRVFSNSGSLEKSF